MYISRSGEPGNEAKFLCCGNIQTSSVHNGVYGLLRLMLGIILENVFSCIVYDFGMITNVIFQYTITYHQP